MPKRVEWFLNGDHVRHLWLLTDEWVAGNLDYTTATSPRAWHTLIAIAWSAADPAQDSRGLLSLISAMSTGMWFAFAVLLLAVGLIAERMARLCGLGARWSGLAGLLAGVALLWPTFLGNYMALGFETAIFCSLLLAVAVLELLLRRGSRGSVIITTAAATLVAHTWQLMMPAALLAVGAAVTWYLSKDRGQARLWLVSGSLSAGW